MVALRPRRLNVRAVKSGDGSLRQHMHTTSLKLTFIEARLKVREITSDKHHRHFLSSILLLGRKLLTVEERAEKGNFNKQDYLLCQSGTQERFLFD